MILLFHTARVADFIKIYLIHTAQLYQFAFLTDYFYINPSPDILSNQLASIASSLQSCDCSKVMEYYYIENDRKS